MQATLESLAYEMVGNWQDYSPESEAILPPGQLLANYFSDGVWVVDTNVEDFCNMQAYIKLYRVTPRKQVIRKQSIGVKPVKSAIFAVLLAVTSHAFAWSHAGSLRSNNESHYGGHARVR